MKQLFLLLCVWMGVLTSRAEVGETFQLGENREYLVKILSEENKEVSIGALYDAFGEVEDGVMVRYMERSRVDGDVTLPSSFTINGQDYKVVEIAEKGFQGSEDLTSVIIPESVVKISDFAFSFCSGMQSVTIPPSVTSIGDGAFNHCESLTTVTIPPSVTSIQINAFIYCTALTSVTIPASMKNQVSDIFDYCPNLTSVSFSN